MLDVLNRYSHGFVVVPVVLACRHGGLFAALREAPYTARELAEKLAANSGHLEVVLRLLESLGWVDRDQHLRYRAMPGLAKEALIPDTTVELVRADMAAYLHGGPSGFMTPWLDLVERRWDVDDALIADFLDSLLVVPVLAQLTKRRVLTAQPGNDFRDLPPGVREEVVRLLKLLAWLEGDVGSYRLTPPGEFMFDRAMNLGVAESYRTMLIAMPDLLFGDATTVFKLRADGHENHVDRTMNVIASGHMHDRYFAEVEDILITIFSKEPFSRQPKFVADMGSGDGTFLKRVYDTVRSKTPRGKRLDEFPLTMIGVDLNQASLRETSRTLGEIPHLLVPGDIGNPKKVVEDISRLGADPNEVLHIRSFLDHDRPYIPPVDQIALAARSPARYLGVYVDRAGKAIPPASAVQSLVEHLNRWSEVVTPHGFILLEVHCQDPLVVRANMDASESLYFDAIEAFSHQFLVEPDAALLAAAEAGLFPRREYFRKYPGFMPYCRITLNLFERRPYRIRLARRSDLPALERLEAECWPAELRTSAEELRRRIDGYALGQWVIELEGEIAGVVYSQRIDDVSPLKTARIDDVARLHQDRGSVVQLLGLNVLPGKQHLGLGDQLLDLMLMRSALQGGVRKVAGVTRCSGFVGRSLNDLRQHVLRRDDDGQPLDPTLRFHASHGAELLEVLPDYRSSDVVNLGAGVLICYDFADSGTRLEPRRAQTAISNVASLDSAARVEACMRAALGPTRQEAFAWQKPLRDVGMDSLDLLQFRTLLQQAFGVPLSPTFFFAHPTPRDIERFLDGVHPPAPATTAPLAAPSIEPTIADRPTEPERPAPQTDAPIAIIGMAGRFPGAANLAALWELLESGRDALEDVPASRWDMTRYYSVDPDVPGTIVSRRGGFLPAVDCFDASFFGITPREAHLMDPQQRQLLEVHWEAFESASIDPISLRDRACGLFVGMHTHDYELLQADRPDTDLDAYYATGNAASIAAGRLAYFFGTRGPALTIDTACSSALVAVHEAMRSLQRGECDVAAASGVNLILSPKLSIAFSRAGMLAPDGRCKTFDAAADGYVRSEGCAVVVLKRLGDAEGDGDPILAVLRGSAVNQDGASNGLTAPSLPAQRELIEAALRNARLEPSDIDYVEAHGTGTRLGDPVEFQALADVFGGDERRKAPLDLGSIKTNVGHTEAAAGLAGLAKVVLAMRHEWLPPTLHFKAVNPLIHLDGIPARIPINGAPWRAADGRPLRAGVSSFGFSGTNAHVVVEQWCVPRRKAENIRPLNLLTIAAKTDAALGRLSERYRKLLSEDGASVADVCYTANVGRAHFERRIAVRGQSARDLVLALDERVGRADGASAKPGGPRIAFLFTGQGSQYIGMARELAASEPVFRDSLAECRDILAGELSEPLDNLLYPVDGVPSSLDETANTQPALFAVEYALSKLLMSWGISPVAVMGHSVGEYVAACIAGVFELRDGLKLIAARGRLMGSLPRDGSMLAILGAVDGIERELERVRDVAVAAYNGPANIVISGRRESVAAIGERLAARGAKVVPLQVSHAFHSPLMAPILSAFKEVARWVRFDRPKLEFVSNVTGTLVRDEVMAPDYWARHIREPVRFRQGVEALVASGVDLLIEVGPHPVLRAMGQECVPDRSVKWAHTLARGMSDWDGLLDAVGAGYELGASIDWRAFHRGRGKDRVALPSYPWEPKRYWFDAIRTRADRPLRFDVSPSEASWPGRRLPTAVPIFAVPLDPAAFPELADHVVAGEPLVPASWFLDLASVAARNVLAASVVELIDVALQKKLPVIAGRAPLVQILFRETGREGELAFEIRSEPDASDSHSWLLHVSGTARKASAGLEGRTIPRRDAMAVATAEEFYRFFARRNVAYGPAFRNVERASRRGLECEAVVAPPRERRDAHRYGFDPMLLDSCLQTLLMTLDDDVVQPEYVFLPIGIDSFVQVAEPRGSLQVHARRAPSSVDDLILGDIAIHDENGAPVATVRGLTLRRAPIATVRAGAEGADALLFETVWQPTYLSSPVQPAEAIAPSRVAALLQPRVAKAEDAAGYETGISAWSDFETLAAAFAVAALIELGVEWRVGLRLERRGVLADRLRVLPARARSFGGLLDLLVRAGVLRADLDGFAVVREADPTLTLEERVRSTIAKHPSCETEARLLARSGGRIAKILRGEADPLEALFPTDSPHSAERLYVESSWSRAYNTLVADAVESIVRTSPAGRKLRVLELGAGTGGTTGAVLRRLPPARTEYVFTDLSKHLLRRSAEKFRDYGFVRYELFDVEVAPATQGAVPGSFDLIVAANVLHATADLRTALVHVKQLLAPGGVLLLLETTAPRGWLDLTFGMTDGWWRFTDHDLRADYPLLAAPRWLALLDELGLHAAAVGGSGEAPRGVFEQHLFVAQQPGVAGEAPRESGPPWWIVADSTGLAEALAGELASRGEIAVTLTRDGDSSIAAELARTSGAPRGVIYCGALDIREPAGDELLLDDQVECCAEAAAIAQVLANASVDTKVWLVTRGAHTLPGGALPAAISEAPLWGFGRTLALELPQLWGGLLDLDPGASVSANASTLADEILAGDGEDQIAWRQGVRHVLRLAPRKTASPSRPEDAHGWRLEASTPGLLDSLSPRSLPPRRLGRDEVAIGVRAAGLNFKDVLTALNVYPGEAGPLGMEFSGVVTACGADVTHVSPGDEVLGLAEGSFATDVVARAAYVLPKPPNLSFADAATVPIAFLTAHFALVHLAKIKSGDRVLLHAASGGVGLAAVQIAQQAGAEVFATAGSPEKRAHLAAAGIAHVYDSRTCEFADAIVRATGGRGVDVVVNCLSGDAIERSLACTARGGRFVEIGKRDIWPPQRVADLGRDLHYWIVDLAATIRSEPALIARMLTSVVDAVAAGGLRTLPKRTFRLGDAQSAFRLMAQTRHIGKIVLEAQMPAGDAPPPIVADGAYLITGGLGALGLRLASWLVERGARHVVLVARDRAAGTRSVSDADERLETMRKCGADVRIVNADVSDRAALSAVFLALRRERVIRGVFHLAGDSGFQPLRELDASGFRRSFAPKILGAWNLHTLTRDLPLDYFVLFSSLTGLLGAKDLAAYTATSTFLDALAQARAAAGLRALSVDWGAWQVIRLLRADSQKSVDRFGLRAMSDGRALAAMSQLVGERAAQAVVADIDWGTLLPAFELRGPRPLLARMRDTISRTPAPAPRRSRSLTEALADSSPAEQWEKLADFVASEIREALALDRSEPIDPDRGLAELGVDSLMSVQLRTRLQAALGRSLSPTITFSYPTVAALTKFLGSEILKLAPVDSAKKVSRVVDAVAADISGLDDEEARRLLAAEIDALASDLRE